MTTWHQRLLQTLNKSEYNKRSLAKAVGVSAPTVTDWTSGAIKEISGANLEKVCSILRVNSRWLMTGKGPETPNEAFGVEEAPADYLPVPFKNIKLRATRDNVTGFEIHFEDDETIRPRFYRRDWLAEQGYRLEALVARRVSGSSMEPALYDGDNVLINMDTAAPKNGKVFAVVVDGHPMIKRLRKRGLEWWITSDNPAHSNTDLPLENEQQLIGQVVEKSSTNV